MIRPDREYKLSKKTIAKYYELKSEDKTTQRKLAIDIRVSSPVVSKLLNNRLIIKENGADYIHAMRLGAKLGIRAKEILTLIEKRGKPMCCNERMMIKQNSDENWLECNKCGKVIFQKNKDNND